MIAERESRAKLTVAYAWEILHTVLAANGKEFFRPILGMALFADGGHETRWRVVAFVVFGVAMVTDRFDGALARSALRRPAPRLGQHTALILARVGVKQARLTVQYRFGKRWWCVFGWRRWFIQH